MASAFTPLFRRFADEASRDRAELSTLFREVRSAYAASPLSQAHIIDLINSNIAENVAKSVELPSSQLLLRALDTCQKEILSLETNLLSPPVFDSLAKLSLKEEAALRRRLRDQKRFLAEYEPALDTLGGTLAAIFAGIIVAIGNLSTSDEDNALKLPLILFIQDPYDLVDRIIGTFCRDELGERGLFGILRDRLYENVCAASGLSPDATPTAPLVTAGDSTLAPIGLVQAYLKDTPFLEFFLTPIPCAESAVQPLDRIDVFISYSKSERAIAGC